MGKEKILVIGANGQIGLVLSKTLAATFGNNAVITTDISAPLQSDLLFEQLNVLNVNQLEEIATKHNINRIYHLAAILSAKGEANPMRSWHLNMNGLFNVLETAKKIPGCKVFFPSSIAVFGEKSDRNPAHQNTMNDPDTVYGISKSAGELWCQYYYQKYNLDVRSVRYPGVIGYQSLPGGGTTDYAVEIFHKALLQNQYTCFLDAHTCLPMIYMPDAIQATIQIMQAPAEKIKIRTSYNITAFSFTPEDLAAEIKKNLPGFTINYAPDFRQNIAEKWPAVINDDPARNDWGWQHQWDFKPMVSDMIQQLKSKLSISSK